jgi:glycolate dehydrogenase FAD-binding subunit
MGDLVLEQLLEATTDHAGDAADGEGVDGVPARWVAAPGSAEQASAVMRVAAEHHLAVVARGAGTKLGWGHPPERVDLLLDTGRMDTVVEHAAGDLIVVAGAGCRLTDLQARLAGAGQWLAVDPARGGTLGGLVATASTGPTRHLRGPVRDLLIGARVVRADGVRAHSGGKVVKNVAGYDVGKLLTGSYGTLAVLTEVAFRLHPLPPTRTWVSVPVVSVAEAHAVTQRVVHSQLAPTAVELDRPADGAWTLSLLLEGIAAGVEGRAERALDLLGTAATASGDPPPWWGREPFEPTGTALKLTFEIAGLRQLLTALEESAAACGLLVDGRGSVGVGTLLAGVRGATEPEPGAVARLVSGLRQRAASYGGSVVVLDAPPHVKAAVDVWGPVPALDLMRAVKSRFDPQRRLAPGRFVGGI